MLATALSLTLFLAACSPSSQPAPVDTGTFWPTYLGNAARAPFTRQRVTFEPPQIVWSTAVAAGLRGMPVVSDQVVIASGTDRYVYALSRQDGSRFWRKRLDGPPSPPLVRGDIIYTATEQRGKLRALGIEQGEDFWKEDFPSVATPLTLEGDTLYVATEDAFMYAIDVGVRGQAWRTRFRRPAIAGPLVTNAWVVYITVDSLYLVNRHDGRLEESVGSPGVIAGEAAADGEALYAATESGSLVAWSLPKLQPLWEISGFDAFLSGPVVARGSGYAVSRSGELVRFDAEEGTAQVIADIEGSVIAPPTVVQNGVLVGTLEGKLYFFGWNGEPIWSVELDGSIEFPVSIHEGRIVVAMYGSTSGILGSTRARGKLTELR